MRQPKIKKRVGVRKFGIMKIFRKIIGITFLLAGIAIQAQPEMRDIQEIAGNNSDVIDSVKSKIENLESRVKDGSYTRIPNTDFENIIDNKIEKSLRETLKWWLFLITAVVSVLGFLVNKYAKAHLQSIVDEKVNLLRQENEAKIKTISNHYFSSVIESLVDFKVENITKKNHIVDESMVDDLKTYLNDESLNIAESKKVSLIDTIMRCYYYNNYRQRTEKMIDLIKEYEEKFTLLQTTYANAAIAFSDMYDRYGNKEYLTSAIENCDKSIRILPDYGLAFAQKLELYTMALMKAHNEVEKLGYETELIKVFNDIENNRSTYLCSELVSRLEVDKETFMGPYLEYLKASFPDEMAKINERAKPVTA